MMTRDKHDQCL